MAIRGPDGAGKGSTSLSKALLILRCVASRNRDGTNLTTLARKERLSIPTAHRILQSLTAEGFLSFDPYSKLYFLGSDAYNLVAQAGPTSHFEQLSRRLHGALERIAEETGDTAYLSARDGNSAACIARVQGSFPISTNTLDLGARRPLGVGAGSLTLLAAELPTDADRIIEANREVYPRYGRLTAERVAKALIEARRNGYAFNNSMVIEGVGAIGVPVFDGRRQIVAAISVAAISSRLRATRRREIQEIVRAALIQSEFQDGGGR